MAGDSLTGQSREALEIAGLTSLQRFESLLQFPYLRHVGKVAYFIEDIGVLLEQEVERYIAMTSSSITAVLGGDSRLSVKKSCS